MVSQIPSNQPAAQSHNRQPATQPYNQPGMSLFEVPATLKANRNRIPPSWSALWLVATKVQKQGGPLATQLHRPKYYMPTNQPLTKANSKKGNEP